jgi:hypothetical protein
MPTVSQCRKLAFNQKVNGVDIDEPKEKPSTSAGLKAIPDGLQGGGSRGVNSPHV